MYLNASGQRFGQSHHDKMDEIKNLKSVVDEQSALINSYERIVQKLKEEKEQENQEAESTNRRQKQEIQELNTKISSLKNKINEYQAEIAALQGKVKSNTSFDEQRNTKIHDKSKELERQLLEKDVILYKCK